MSPTPVDTRALRHALGQFATGVTVVTCLDGDGAPAGMTANSFASVSLHPPLVLWSLDRRAGSFEAFCAAQAYAFSVLAHDQMGISNKFARGGADKFAGTAWTAGREGVPLIDDAAAVFECEQHATFDGGDHLIIVGRVMRFNRFERRPLVFAQSRYGIVAPHPGDAGDTAPDAPEVPSYDNLLLPLLFRAYDRLYRPVREQLVSEDTSGAQVRILAILAAHAVAAPEEVLNRTMLSQSSFEDALAALVSAGFAERRPDGLAITDSGRMRLATLLRLAADREVHSTGGLEPAETELLRTLLRKLVAVHDGG